MNTSIEKQVVTNYTEYDGLLKFTKISKRDNFMLADGTGPKKDWNLADLSLTHVSGTEGNLVTEQSKKKSTKYRLILFIKSFSVQPLCRFDSDGIAHENIILTKPLTKRKIETPHFHQYDSRGFMYAFKTENLIKFEKDIRDNIQNGLSEMCSVYNIFTDKKAIPCVVGAGSIFPKEDMEDLHRDIIFPI